MIDTHVHLFPDDVIWRFKVWIERKHKFETKMGLDWRSAMDKLKEMGIKEFFNLTHSITPEMTKELLDWQIEMKKKFNCIAFSGFHPDNDIELLYDIFDKGIDGLKLHPAVQRFKPNSKEALRIYEVLDELKKPLYIHAGYFPDNAFEFSSPEQFSELANNYDFPVIIAHMIVGRTKAICDLFDSRKNIYSDTSNALVKLEIFDSRIKENVRFFCEDVVEVIESYPDRILYGSEIPIVWWEPEETLRNLKENFDEKIVRMITEKNPKNFINRYIR